MHPDMLPMAPEARPMAPEARPMAPEARPMASEASRWTSMVPRWKFGILIQSRKKNNRVIASQFATHLPDDFKKAATPA